MCFRPQRENDDPARPFGKPPGHLIGALETVDDGDGAAVAGHGDKEPEPIPERRCAFDRRPALGRIGRRVAAAGGQIRRIGHDVIEPAGREPFRRREEVPFGERHPFGKAAGAGAFAGQGGKVRL